MNDSATLPEVHVCQPWGPNTPDRAFAQLVDAVHECRRCPRMEGRRRVLGQANGPLSARLLFVAEAPGRLGAEVSGVPLTGDRAGRTFAALLEAGGFERSAIFVTNAVLCNPRDAAGRNDRPTCREVANCGPHLVRLLQILRPDWVVTLGAVALHAVGRVMPHGLVLGRDVGRPIAWQGRWLVPLYHPGPRALIHRPLAVQQVDYACLAALVASQPGDSGRVPGRAVSPSIYDYVGELGRRSAAGSPAAQAAGYENKAP